jgi:lipoprotein NlpI
MKRCVIGPMPIGLAALLAIGLAGCSQHNETLQVQRNQMPKELQQRLQQMSPQMRARLEPQVNQVMRQRGMSANTASAPTARQ